MIIWLQVIPGPMLEPDGHATPGYWGCVVADEGGGVVSTTHFKWCDMSEATHWLRGNDDIAEIPCVS